VSDPDPPWTATVTVRTSDPAVAHVLERALRPEAEREVPRARAELHDDPATGVELRISARDAGAMRAALNTYLGWVQLALATLGSAPTSRSR
jgi:tRNA threonylcarbamoyladenosine modification (KEOPS) complex  Pcc1 subunit